MSLPYQTNTFYIIPTSITMICLNYFGNNFCQYCSAGDNDQAQLGRKSSDSDEKSIDLIPELNNIVIKDICMGTRASSVFWICNDNKLYIHGKNEAIFMVFMVRIKCDSSYIK